MKRGIATFGLDWGKCPRWLFEKMVRLSSYLIEAICLEFGPEEFIKRISDPVWFQSFGNVLAFDWNSSGLTTTLTAALKEAIKNKEKHYGLFICGGKGKTSRKTPDEILDWSEKIGLHENQAQKLIYNSKITAKVDSSLIQDGYQIYHHSFIFHVENISHTPKVKNWAVIQQGMNIENSSARRYHWYSEKISNIIVEPHTGIVSQSLSQKPVLNLTAIESEKNRDTSIEILNQPLGTILNDFKKIEAYRNSLSKMIKLIYQNSQENFEFVDLQLKRGEFYYHRVLNEDFSQNKYLLKIISKLKENSPQNYEEFLATEGVGPKIVRALSLISEIIYNAPASFKDPARYSFAHGGKDGTPYPVDKKTYEESIYILERIIQKSKTPLLEKNKMLQKIKRGINE